MEETHQMEIRSGFDTLYHGEITFFTGRHMCFYYAKKLQRNVELRVYNEALRKWQTMNLVYRPDGIAVDNRGVEYKLDKDGRNFWPIKK